MSEGPERLRVQAFRATSRRVKCARFHPVLSVVAMADKDELLQVWDFESKQVIFEARFGDDPPKADLQALAAAEGTGKAASSPPAGGIRDLAFCDADVLHCEASRQAAMRGAPAPGPLDHAPPGPLKASRLLTVLCEHRVVLVDLLCGSRQDLPRSALDGKPPCALTVARRTQGGEPLLCIATTDGSVRCVPLRGASQQQQQPPTTLVSPSKSPPTCIVALSGASASGGDKLLAGTTDGGVLVWDPLGGGTGRDVSPQTSHKAHEGAVLSVALLPPRPDRPVRPEGSSLRLATLGAENRVAIWALAPFQELSRAKPLSKVSLCSVSYTPHGPPGVLLCSTGAQVYRLTEPGALEQLCSLTSQLFPAASAAAGDGSKASSSSSKASVKASLCLTHPSRPNLAALACSAGLTVLSFGPAEPAAAVGLLGSASASASDGISYAVAHNGDLWAVACKAAPPAAAAGTGGGILATDVTSCGPVAKLPGASGCVALSVSPCGRLVSACWPEARTGVVYRSRGSSQGGSEPWEKVWEGQAASLAWSGQGDHTSSTFAALDLPPPSSQTGGRGGSKAKKGLGLRVSRSSRSSGGANSAQMEAALEAARIAADSAAKVVVRRVSLSSGAAEEVPGELGGSSSSVPKAVHGGALLGVAFKGLPGQGSGAGLFRFHSWSTREPAGEAFPEPSWVRWDSFAELCALGYEQEVVVCRFQARRLQRVASVAAPGVTSALWGVRQLLLASPEGLDLALVDRGSSSSPPDEGDHHHGSHSPLASPRGSNAYATQPLPPLLQTIRIAGLRGPPGSDLLSGSGATSSTPLAPYGPLQVLGASGSLVWVADPWGQPHALELPRPSVRARSLAAAGDAEGARRAAAGGGSGGAVALPAEQEAAAAFMAAADSAGARHAVDLPGVSLRSRLALATQAGLLPQALRCLQAFAAGCPASSSVIQQHQQQQRHGSSASLRTPSGFSLAGTSMDATPSGPLTPSSRSEDGNNADFLGDLNTPSPLAAALKGLNSGAAVPFTSSGEIDWDSGATTGGASAIRGASSLPYDAARAGIRLADEALAAGDHMVAAGAISLFSSSSSTAASGGDDGLDGVGGLTRLSLRLRALRCGLDGSSSVDSGQTPPPTMMGPSSSASARGAVLAAALGGEDPAVVARALAALPPEAALYCRTWLSGEAPEQIQPRLRAWNGALLAATSGTRAVS